MPSNYVNGEHFEALQQKHRASKVDALRAEIDKGEDSGRGVHARKVFADVRAAIAKAHPGNPPASTGDA